MKKQLLTVLAVLSAGALTACSAQDIQNAAQLTSDMAQQIDMSNVYIPAEVIDNEMIGATIDQINAFAAGDNEQVNAFIDYFKEGHCFIACQDDSAVVLYIDGKDAKMEHLSYVKGKLQRDAVDGEWLADGRYFDVVNEIASGAEGFSWTGNPEVGDKEIDKVLGLWNDYDEMFFYEINADSFKQGERIAKSYITNKKDLEDVRDITTVLSEYQGVSAVEAFIMEGLGADMETRAAAAAAVGIENYHGTAEQNMMLIQLLGGNKK